MLTETLQKFVLEYGHSHFKSAFGINFQHQEVVKLRIRKYAYRVFSVGTLPEVEN